MAIDVAACAWDSVLVSRKDARLLADVRRTQASLPKRSGGQAKAAKRIGID